MASLPLIDNPSVHSFTAPVKRINSGSDVTHFLSSLAYRDIGLFILQLDHALCPRKPADPSSPPRSFPLPDPSEPSVSPSARQLQSLIRQLDALVALVDPVPGPRRFGNAAFSSWLSRAEPIIHEHLTQGRLGDTLVSDAACREVASYVIAAFGSHQRLDYGTGHELSFLAFLACLWKLRFFDDGTQSGDIERRIVLDVFEPYLRLVRKLILRYNLEPAGSHGVWGLDDHSFLPYIFGSAQLTRPISDNEPMPLEGSVPGAPKPSDVTNVKVVDDNRSINMYFSAIGFINDVKKGPFWEHSPILYDISGIRDGWGKINKGMIKMFNAEVLSKFPVVQHFPFGSLFSWDEDPEALKPAPSIHVTNQPPSWSSAAQHTVTGTSAPWTQETNMPPTDTPGIPYSRIPPGPRTGSLAFKPPRGGPTMPSTAAQITLTKAPWAKDA
ncbi:hypothetical protein CDD81_864 [Ophiocordyceps australis]|uniref:Serine/threonine-protein phosphatase 2A activator n=1 Tax=Ophiocordyceps australis TaxID=1399860 RepID=A0A2C5YDZ2_9HYPO|nr:hypothetical protein CDD81_864 [Ophiocordyceps australis]